MPFRDPCRSTPEATTARAPGRGRRPRGIVQRLGHSPHPGLSSGPLSQDTSRYANGARALNQASLTNKANTQTKTYGSTFTFAGTEFSASGLVNGDTISSVTLTSAGAAATATVAGS